MDNITRMTMQQAEEELRVLSRVFTCARLLDEDSVPVEDSTFTRTGEPCHCFDIWKREHRCKNCTTAKAFAEKKSKTKLEMSDNAVFEVTSRYLEIDDKPYVMELIREFDNDLLADFDGSTKLAARLNDYYGKIYQDVLTGCNNRRFYEERLKNASIRAGVALLDIDDFKLYNDVYGHAAGDVVLRAAAKEIRKCIRATDKLIRFGGDEFLIVMPGVDSTVFSNVLYNIRSCINNVTVKGFSGIRLTVSIGGVCSGTELMNKLTEQADALMYRAKQNKNTIVTDRDIDADTAKERPNILIVDDSELNREILASILGNEFNIIEADSGEACIACLRNYGTRLSVVLLDIVMPGISGFDVLSYMNANRLIEEIPVITITGDESDQSIRRAYELGVSDYIGRPFDVKVVYRRVVNTIQLYSKQRRLIKRVTEQVREKEDDSRIMVGILSQIVEFQNGESGRHVIMIRELTRKILERLALKTDRYHLNARDIDLISNASALHDIGKIAIDKSILNKPGNKLSPEELELVKSHTVIGADMLWDLEEYRNEPLVRYAWQICRYHHEHYDGSGYPVGLKGEDIPIAAQVVAVCDVYDELVSKRVCKDMFSHEKAMQIICGEEKEAFNPILLECLQEMSDELIEMYIPEHTGGGAE